MYSSGHPASHGPPPNNGFENVVTLRNSSGSVQTRSVTRASTCTGFCCCLKLDCKLCQEEGKTVLIFQPRGLQVMTNNTYFSENWNTAWHGPRWLGEHAAATSPKAFPNVPLSHIQLLLNTGEEVGVCV